jgi:spore coat protein U-like protein
MGHPLLQGATTTFPATENHMTSLRTFFIIVLILAATGTAFAAPANGTLSVMAVITLNNGNCSIGGTQSINFGTLDPLSPQAVLTASGSVTYQCKGLGNKGATVNVTLASATPLTLTRASLPAFSIPYSINLPVASFVPPNGTGIVTVPITAQMLGSDYRLAPSGVYNDTITIQLTP